MSERRLTAREAFDLGPRPPRFTGLWRGMYFYKGQRWGGQPNFIGYGKPFAVGPDGELYPGAQRASRAA